MTPTKEQKEHHDRLLEAHRSAVFALLDEAWDHPDYHKRLWRDLQEIQSGGAGRFYGPCLGHFYEGADAPDDAEAFFVGQLLAAEYLEHKGEALL